MMGMSGWIEVWFHVHTERLGTEKMDGIDMHHVCFSRPVLVFFFLSSLLFFTVDRFFRYPIRVQRRGLVLFVDLSSTW